MTIEHRKRWPVRSQDLRHSDGYEKEIFILVVEAEQPLLIVRTNLISLSKV